MIYNYIKSTFRGIFASKLFSLIHIIGLSIGLAACFIMLMIVIHEYSYDRYNEKLDNIYRVYTYSPILGEDWFGVPYPLYDNIKANIPEIDNAARTIRAKITVNIIGDENFFEERMAKCVDEEVFDILTLPMLAKAGNKLFPDPNSILVSRKVAEKYFNNEDPIGKVVSVQNRFPQYEANFTITGVFEDIPQTSTFKADYLLPMEYERKMLIKLNSSYQENYSIDDDWSIAQHLEILILKKDNADIAQLTAKMPKYKDFGDSPYKNDEYRLQEYSSVHLNGSYINYNVLAVDDNSFKIFAAISLLILLIACFNFIIMSISRFKGKYKDVGIRKVLGAGRKNIGSLIIIESVVYSLLSFPVTLLLVLFFYRTVSEYLSIDIADNYFWSFGVIIIFLSLTILVGLISGIYSVIKLSNLTPLQTIFYRKTSKERKIKSIPVFLVIQMVVFIALIFGAIVIKQQTNYFMEGDLGFCKDNILLLMADNLNDSEYNTLEDELKKSPYIKNAGGAFTVPPSYSGAYICLKQKDDPTKLYNVNVLGVDYDFMQTMEMRLTDGRYLNEKYSSDAVNSVIFNETAAKALKVSVGDEIGGMNVIGIANDFKFSTLHKEVPVMGFNFSEGKYCNEIAIKYSPGTEDKVIKHIKNVWTKLNPDKLLDYSFMDERFAEIYESDYNFAALMNASSFLSIFIACLGLFGFTVFNTQQRIKEIGIRRVLGASLFNILSIFVKQFLWLIILASIFGLLAGDYLINKWLETFAYHINVLPLYFVITAIVCSIVIISTISIYVIKTTLSNPVEALRYE